MKKIFFFIFTQLPVFILLIASPTYEQWQAVAPYLLPDNHPAKPILDEIFQGDRIVINPDALKEAGFTTKGIRNWSQTVVARHPKLKGYVIKLLTDDILVDEVPKLTNRIKGANLIRNLIAYHHFEKHFKVPRKWIYPLPLDYPPALPGHLTKYFILIAEDMDLLEKEENYARWESSKVKEDLLAELFILITEAGAYDCVYAFNLPFSKDRRISFIDTEEHNGWPVPYYKLNDYLNTKNQLYWTNLYSQ